MAAWISLALGFAAVMAAVNVLDKRIIERYAPSIHLYALWAGFIELGTGCALLAAVSYRGLDTSTALGGALTGLMRAISFLLLLAALRRGQVARVIPIFYSYPILVALMAALLLSESLPAQVWGAAVLVVIGVWLVSWERVTEDKGFGGPRTLLLALAASAIFALSTVISKQFLDDGSLWDFYSGSRVAFGLGLVGVLVLPDVRRGLVGAFRIRGFTGIVVLAELLVTAAIVMYLSAINLGPVSRVATVGAVLPSLIFIYSLILAKFYPGSFGHWVTRSTIRPQVIGITTITAGVVIVTIA